MHEIIEEFRVGVEDEPIPSAEAVELAIELVDVIVTRSKLYNLNLDIDGALSFEAKTGDERLITGEFSNKGKLYSWIYQDVYGDRMDEILGGTDLVKFKSWF